MEYVAAAYIAGDERLLAPLREGKDFHELTAEMIGIERSQAKTVNFGVLYGMGATGLGRRLGVSEAEAQGYINKLFDRAPGLKEWWKKQARDARQGVGYATTPLGRRRLVDMTRASWRINGWEANRSQLLNHPIQGGCADGYKMAGALIWENRNAFAGNPLIVNMVHDEYVLEVDAASAATDARLLEELMVSGMKEAIGDAPVKVDVTIADRWMKED
jgi:DNA polymerase-1